MTTFERLYIADPAAQVEIKDPYYRHIADPRTAEHILREFGLSGEGSHIVNGHVPVRAIEGESPIKGGGRLIIIDGGFCRAYHRRTGIAGYTLVYNSRGLILRTSRLRAWTRPSTRTRTLPARASISILRPSAFWCATPTRAGASRR